MKSPLPFGATDVCRWPCGCVTYTRPDPKAPPTFLTFVLDPCDLPVCRVQDEVRRQTRDRGMPLRLQPRGAA